MSTIYSLACTKAGHALLRSMVSRINDGYRVTFRCGEPAEVTYDDLDECRLSKSPLLVRIIEVAAAKAQRANWIFGGVKPWPYYADGGFSIELTVQRVTGFHPVTARLPLVPIAHRAEYVNHLAGELSLNKDTSIILASLAPKKRVIASGGSLINKGNDHYYLSESGLRHVVNHSHSIVDINLREKKFVIVSPWNTGRHVSMSFSEATSSIEDIMVGGIENLDSTYIQLPVSWMWRRDIEIDWAA